MTSVMPMREVLVENETPFALEAKAGKIVRRSPVLSAWIAPEKPGHYSLVAKAEGGEVRIEAFVMRPHGEILGGKLNGYIIGVPAVVAGNRAPEGYIEVTRENEGTKVSPHFALKQFLCKQTGGYPKYVELREKLVLKLERIARHLIAKGFRGDAIRIMSGYRTPAYNRSLGNVKDSRHTKGDAADIYVDSGGDGRMDDLNHNGKSDVGDAFVLAGLVEELEDHPTEGYTIGGVGIYAANGAHGPFVHVDARGTRARWGVGIPAKVRAAGRARGR